jgi:hypothetical protein
MCCQHYASQLFADLSVGCRLLVNAHYDVCPYNDGNDCGSQRAVACVMIVAAALDMSFVTTLTPPGSFCVSLSVRAAHILTEACMLLFKGTILACTIFMAANGMRLNVQANAAVQHGHAYGDVDAYATLCRCAGYCSRLVANSATRHHH